MKLKDVIFYAVRSIKNKKLRTWLTLTGIVIGLLTILLIVSIGDGVKVGIEDQLSDFGSDNMMVLPFNLDEGLSKTSMTASPNTGKLFERDGNRIKRIAGVESVSNIIYWKLNVVFNGESLSDMVSGSNSEIFEQWSGTIHIEKGRAFKNSEKYVAVVGYDFANELFGNDKVNVGSSIYIDGKKFKVVGLLSKIGSSLSSSDDSAVYIPLDTERELLGNLLAKDEVSMINVKINDKVNQEDVKSDIESVIANSHKVKLDDKDFSVITAKEIKQTVDSVIGSLSIFLLFIAGVASLVSGVGIMNTMYMSIMEKTKEIGILKSLGAKKEDIMKIFIAESLIIAGVGGLIGIFIGILLAVVISYFGITAITTPTLIIGTFLFSISIGVIAGVLPAKKASEMNPIDALRK